MTTSRLFSRALGALVCLSALAACDSAQTDSGEPEALEPQASAPISVIVPLAVGNEWTYQEVFTAYADDGRTVTRVDTVARPATLRITGTVQVSGETYYVTSRTGGASLFPELLTNRRDGLYALSANRPGGPMRVVAYPASPGTQFGSSTWGASIDDLTTFTYDSDITLKVTDLPTSIAGTAYEGYLYTVVPRRFRVGGVEYPIDPLSNPFRWLLVPDVGYATYQNQYYQIDGPTGVMRLLGRVALTLQSFTVAPPRPS